MALRKNLGDGMFVDMTAQEEADFKRRYLPIYSGDFWSLVAVLEKKGILTRADISAETAVAAPVSEEVTK